MIAAAVVSPSPSSSTLPHEFENPQVQQQHHQGSTDSCSSTLGARKRRRQILQSQRQNKTETPKEGALEIAQSSLAPQSKRPRVNETDLSDDASSVESLPLRKVSHCDGVVPSVNAQDTKNGNKPQMRYEPSVPMTKEQAAAWRREQRRKRNRESAAASRQRQRDRIVELEKEVEDWKGKFESAMERLKKLEDLFGQELARSSHLSNRATSPNLQGTDMPKTKDLPALHAEESKAVSPCPSPELSPVTVRATMPSQNSSTRINFPQVCEKNADDNNKITLCTPLEISNEHLKEIQSLPA